jgi:hypothetical protein
MNPVRKKYMPRRQGNNPDMAISTRLGRVLLQPNARLGLKGLQNEHTV